MNARIRKLTLRIALLACLANPFHLMAQQQLSLPVTGTSGSVDFEWRLDGSIVEKGYGTSTLSNADLQSSSRFIWYPTLNALRAGESLGQDSLTNIGAESAAFGLGSIASGFAAFAAGGLATAGNEGAAALGFDVTASSIGSAAFGDMTSAVATCATAMGMTTTASGQEATAMGYETTASGMQAVATGYFNQASGYSSTAMGSYNFANSYDCLVIGSMNVGLSETGATPSTTGWVATDPLLELGNGGGTRTDALVVYKNGNTTISGTDNELPNQVIIGTGSILTKGLGDSRYLQLGTLQLGDASASGAVAFGTSTLASGTDSTAMGLSGTASGYVSTAMGYDTLASGKYSIASGYGAVASGTNGTAFGYETAAVGAYSTALGIYTTGTAYDSFVVGQYNIGGGSPTSWVATDPLFEVGDGTSSTPSDALEVKKDGDTTLAGALVVTGTTGNPNQINGTTTLNGTVMVSGSTNVILIHPAGDLSMGPFTSGSSPL